MKIGVLALQGAFREHLRALRELGVEPRLIKYPEQLGDLWGLIIPGGESTTMSLLMDRIGLRDAIIEAHKEGLALFGTCSGLILLSKEVVEDKRVVPLGLLPVKVERNAYGRQRESFRAPVQLDFSPEPFEGVFIRAPKIVDPQRAKVVARLGQEPVGVVAERVLGVSFHPELTGDLRVHEFFLSLAKK